MRPLFMWPAALVLAATSASAQTVERGPRPAAYLCTPDAQVIKVTEVAGSNVASLVQFQLPRNKTTAVVPVPSGSSSAGISECVLGPDGLLYAARGYSIVRFPVANPAATDVKLVANLPTSVSATGVAFNVDTLYVSTSENETLAIPHATGAVPINSAFTEVGTGQGGVAFGIDGTLVVSSTTPSGVVNNYAPPYGGTPVGFTIAAPKGVAVNTCGEVLVADKTSKSVKRASDGALRVQFSGSDFPVHLEVEPGNRLFVVTVQNDSGLNGKLWLANFALSDCSQASPVLLADLAALTKGPNKLAGLASSLASGVAVAPGDVAITHSFAPDASGACVRTYDFGYHQVRFTFPDCNGVSGNLKLTAVKSLFGDVDFASSIDPANTLTGMRYSPLGGHVIQYLLEPSGALKTLSDQTPSQLPEFKAKYGFFTQESTGEPGVAKQDGLSPTSPFDKLVGVEYWNVGSLDPAAGERERDFSKRVIYNKTLEFADCQIPDLLNNPLNHQNPLFNGPQNIKFAFTAIGGNCAGAQVRLSIVRVFGAVLDQACNVIAGGENASYETQEVRKTNGVPGDNLFSSSGSSYQLNLDASLLNTSNPPAQFIATIWGELAAPKNFCFQISKQ